MPPAPSKIKLEFMEKWIKGLQVCSKARKKMSFYERKNAIKLSADIAMASTRMSTTSWSHALITNASHINPSNKILVEHIIGAQIIKKTSFNYNMFMTSKRIRCKKILRRSCTFRRVKKCTRVHLVEANSIAKRLVKKRTQLLKGLVPGGECMDEVSLIKETLDYVLSLRIQVDVMKQLADQASGKLDHNQGQHMII